MTALLFVCVILAWASFGIWLVVSQVRQMRRFKSWAARDEELLNRWLIANDARDCDEAERLRYGMRKNWEAYRQP